MLLSDCAAMPLIRTYGNAAIFFRRVYPKGVTRQRWLPKSGIAQVSDYVRRPDSTCGNAAMFFVVGRLGAQHRNPAFGYQRYSGFLQEMQASLMTAVGG